MYRLIDIGLRNWFDNSYKKIDNININTSK
jgi:hypothetical protein